MIEYHSNKEAGVAVKVFEVGLKIFAHDVDFVMRYLQFLLSINDDTSKSPSSQARRAMLVQS